MRGRCWSSSVPLAATPLLLAYNQGRHTQKVTAAPVSSSRHFIRFASPLLCQTSLTSDFHGFWLPCISCVFLLLVPGDPLAVIWVLLKLFHPGLLLSALALQQLHVHLDCHSPY